SALIHHDLPSFPTRRSSDLMLRSEHKYHINAMHGKEFFSPDNVVPWDNNLCLMSMYGLMNYEKNPELLIMYRMSLENSWLHISKDRKSTRLNSSHVKISYAV